jgi:cold shock CspA family protein
MKQEGQIIFYRKDKGFGYIESENGQKIFFHINDFIEFDHQPATGERVKFHTRTQQKSPYEGVLIAEQIELDTIDWPEKPGKLIARGGV